MTGTATLERARTALQKRAWAQAYEDLTALNDTGDAGLAAEDLQGLGEAAWWSAHPKESLDAFERAYAAYVAEGNPVRAAAVALRLANDYAESMDAAVWNGWVRSAARLLEGQPESAEHGWLAAQHIRGVLMFGRGTLEEAVAHADRIHEIGVRLGDRELEAFGLAFQGMLLVAQAQVEQGLSLVDEAAAAASGGELTPFGAGNIYCITISVCRGVADYRRAGQWTEAAARWCDREAVTGFPGVCRVYRAEIMRLRGDYSEAEAEARTAVEALTAFGMRMSMGWGYNEIGEVRMRLGDLDGADEAFEQAHQLGKEPQPGLALLYLARGRVDAARASIGTALADQEDPLDRARLLPARVEIALAAHDLADAREAADELLAIASTYDKPMLHAAAHQALGTALAFEEDAAAAIAELRKAVRHWTEAEAPFEAAQARRSPRGRAPSRRRRGVGGDGAEGRQGGIRWTRRTPRGGALRRVDRARGREGDAGRRVTRTFMFTDIVGSTNLLETMGDEAWTDVLRWHDETLADGDRVPSGRGGRTRPATGSSRPSPTPAAGASCAVAIQRRLAEHRRKHGFAPQVRIGMHAAEATAIGGRLRRPRRARGRPGRRDRRGGRDPRVALDRRGGTVRCPSRSRTSARCRLKGLAQPVRVVSIDWQA